MSAALIIYAVLVALSGGIVARRVPERRRFLALWAGAVGVTLATTAALAPALSPDDVIVLHEGDSIVTVHRIHGLSLSAGPGFAALLEGAFGNDASTLWRLAELNRILTPAGAVLLAAWIHGITGRLLLSLLAGALFLFGPVTVRAASSELSAPLVLLICLCGGLSAAFWSRVTRPVERAVMLLTLLLGTALVAVVRMEVAVVGGAALVVILGAGSDPDFDRRWDRAIRRVARRVARAPIWLWIALIAGLVASRHLPMPGSTVWLRAVIDPLDPASYAFIVHLATLLPISVVTLALVGLWRGLWHIRSTVGLAYGFWALAQLYHAAAHNGRASYEIARYYTFLLPSVFLLAAIGWRDLERRSASWAPWMGRLGVFALLATTAAGWPAGIRSPGQHKVVPSEVFELPCDVQRETRFILKQLQAEPRCALLARLAPFDPENPGTRQWLLFGAGVTRPIPIDPALSAEAAARAHTPAGACVRVLEPLDCSRVGVSCEAALGDRPILREERFSAIPYNIAEEYGASRPHVRLSIRALSQTEAATGRP